MIASFGNLTLTIKVEFPKLAIMKTAARPTASRRHTKTTMRIDTLHQVVELRLRSGRKVELVQACRVGDYFDFDDFPALDRQGHHGEQAAAWGHDEAGGSVHQRRLRVQGLDHLSLACAIGVGNRGRSMHPAAGSAGQLPCRGRGAAHEGSDLIERHGEHVVQHEREPFGGIEGVEDHQ
jgi:hypothetical protein